MSVSEFRHVKYAGSVHDPSLHPASFDIQAHLRALTSKNKKQKVLLRVSPQEIALLHPKTNELILKIPSKMITWAQFDQKLHCLVVMDTYMTPQQCHFLVSKQHGSSIYRHIMHRLGVQSRMDAVSTVLTSPDSAAEEEVTVNDFPKSFQARFLGALSVTKKQGQEVVLEALSLLKQKLQEDASKIKMPPGKPRRTSSGTSRGNNVAIVISIEECRVLDILTRAVITTILVDALTYLTAVNDEEEGELLALISHDERLDRCTIHFFQCAEGQTSEMIKLLQFASYLRKQRVDDEAFDPFAAKPQPESDISLLDQIKINPRLLAKSLPRECFAPVKTLASGQFGKYYLSSFMSEESAIFQDGLEFEFDESSTPQLAVYVIQDDISLSERAQITSACEILSELNQDNIISLFGISVTECPWLIAFEFAAYGNVASIIKTCREKEIAVRPIDQLHLAFQLVLALEHLHKHRCVHMDVQASNCLLTNDGCLKLAGFFNAHKYDPDTDGYILRSRTKLALRWLAVETFTQNPRFFSEASDVWGFGITLWELLTAQVPYYNSRLTEVHQEVPKGLRPTRPEGCSDSLWQLLESTWLADKDARPRFSQVHIKLVEEFQLYAGQQPKDLGREVNEALPEKIEVLTRKATRRHNSRRSSQRASTGAFGAMTFGDAVTRTNPVFGGQLESIWELDLSDIDDEEEDEDEVFDDGSSVPGKAQRTSGLENLFRPSCLKESSPGPEPSAPRKRSSTIDLGGMLHQHVILLPQDDADGITNTQRQRNRDDRIALLQRNPSRKDLDLNPDLFIPDG
eukprot:m.25366 g.25366  ORF g.25366 m.25366 type:complete len:801 (+) comp9842_c0_seq1:268-2670(+)